MSSSQNPSPNPGLFSVRIVSIDYYMAPPIPGLDICYSRFQGGEVKEVPVIRIYGATPAGQKTCLHVHRALPYLYVPLSEIAAENTHQKDNASIDEISSALESALSIKNLAGNRRQHVHGCNLVRAKRSYGYHSTEELFVKIYLYYPSDIARAAALLLGSAVLGRCIQPYESHIPFLLQFLVDYNLYGMGHLHTSNVKLRLPLPDMCVPRPALYKEYKIGETVASARKKLEADSVCETNGTHPVWISSTVPSGWIWQTRTSGNYGVVARLVKRQSICELEGDCCLEDIQNQTGKLYTSLSQTKSATKLVQSLIPIWEEEYQRTGVQELFDFSDCTKPPPAEVLRGFSVGLDYERMLTDLITELQKDSSEAVHDTENRSIQQFPDLASSVAQMDNLIPASFLNLAGPIKDTGNDGLLSEQLNVLSQFEQSSASQQALMDLTQVLPDVSTNANLKVADNEDIRLLSWLASSQAADDIYSDDEIGCGIVSCPLLHKVTYKEALERAHVEYESASQKECQDILDSIKDVKQGHPEVEYADFNENDATSFHSDSTTPQFGGNDATSFQSDSVIPQFDGAFDDVAQISDGKACESSESQRSSSGRDKEINTRRHSGRSKRKMKWASLPLSTEQNEQKCNSSSANSVESASADMTNCCNSSGTNNVCKTEPHTYNLEIKSQKTSLLRDLMRRKRLSHSEMPELQPSLGATQQDLSENDKVTPTDVESHCMIQHSAVNIRPSLRPCAQLQMDESSDISSQCCEILTMPIESCNALSDGFSARTVSCSSLGLNVISGTDLNISMQSALQEKFLYLARSCERLRSGLEDSTAYEEQHKHALTSHVDKCELDGAGSINTELTCKENLFPHMLGAAPSKSENLLVADFKLKECIGGSNKAFLNVDFNDKNKQTEVRNEVSSMNQDEFGHSFQKGIRSCDPTKTEKLFEMKFNMKLPTSNQLISTEIMADLTRESNTNCCTAAFPFFDCELEETHQKKFICEEVSDSIKSPLGVPSQCQNDGCTLYLLTYANVPPSPESVQRWLSNQGGHNSSQLLKRKGCFSGKEKEINSNPTENQLCSHYSLHEASPICSLSSQASQFSASDQPFVQFELGGDKKQDYDTLSEHKNLKPASENMTITDARTSDIGCSFDPSGNGSGGSWPNVSQLSGPDQKSKLTPLSQIGFRDPASTGSGQQLTLMSIEVQAECRGDLRPDPQFDAVNIIVIVVQEDFSNDHIFYVLLRGNDLKTQRNFDGIHGCNFVIIPDEKKMFAYLANIIQLVDPDILMGWEIQGSSLGFIAERAARLGINLLKCLSRTPISGCEHGAMSLGIDENGIDMKPESLGPSPVRLEESLIEDEWGRTHASGIHVGGRIVLNLWRLMRGEVKLNMYSLEAVADEILRRKIPSIPSRVLNHWFLEGINARFRCIEHLKERAKLNLAIIGQLDMINRTSELARVFGIDFFSVLSRGSQYRVESMMLRLAHSQNYLALSPGNQQVALQPAMECLPLVMEPMSGFYADPVVVLDFQSLYPSMIIAYNLCYSTCLGNILPSKAHVLGVTSFSSDRQLLMELNEHILMCPNGVMYLPSKIRKGILPRLLEEILSTRIMVKHAMKKFGPSEQVLQRIYNARQLALKLIANVTYGYTAAGFSGRMPCAELADSIVQCGRKTLETAIAYVNEHAEWNAKVVYGDTDSMFVLLKGCTTEEAFEIGNKIASAITAMNPNPVTLKLEKVYYPCFLLTKKRYVGYSYENPNQQTPKFDAKGIETIRRDTCQAVSKILEKSLRVFFESQDVSKVKTYLKRQWSRILLGRMSLQDFIFAKEVRLGTYSTSASLPPAAIVAAKAMRVDPRAEPHYGERIPFVVIHGEPGSRLVDMVVNPLDLVEISSPYRLNEIYYIKKQIIPALQRVFGLLGADLNSWFSEVPRRVRSTLGRCQYHTSSAPLIHETEENNHKNTKTHAKRSRIDSYYISKHCCVCGCMVQSGSYICDECYRKGPEVAAFITGKTSKLEKEIKHLSAICGSCGGADFIFDRGVKCTSLACSVFFERRKVQKELLAFSSVATQLGLYPKCFAEWF